jgi:transcriptional regulator with XRE-family HTH domain
MQMIDVPENFILNARLRALAILQNDSLNFNDDSNFTAIVAIIIKCCDVKSKELADILGTSKSSVSRWANGATLPWDYMRPSIITKLTQHLSELTVSDLPQPPGS